MDEMKFNPSWREMRLSKARSDGAMAGRGPQNLFIPRLDKIRCRLCQASIPLAGSKDII